jgi:hypothetical protein
MDDPETVKLYATTAGQESCLKTKERQKENEKRQRHGRRGNDPVVGYGGVRRIGLGFIACVVTTVFVVVACSARQNQSGQSNIRQQPAAADWKAVAQALGKEGSVQPGDSTKLVCRALI